METMLPPHMPFNGNIRNCCVALAFLFVLALPAVVRSASDPDATEQAGVLETELRERQEKKRLEELRFPDIETHLEEAEPFELPATEFFISSIQIIGNTVFSSEIMDELKASYEQKMSSLKDLKSLAMDITAYYRTRGYVTSRALIPPQKITEGKVQIQIIEGKVGNIAMEGLRFSRESMIRKRFRVRTGEILRYQSLERSLGTLNANPDREVRIVLVRGEKPETTDIILKLEEKFPVHAQTIRHVFTGEHIWI
jgi:hemolysin activation/secretion protein